MSRKAYLFLFVVVLQKLLDVPFQGGHHFLQVRILLGITLHSQHRPSSLVSITAKQLCLKVAREELSEIIHRT